MKGFSKALGKIREGDYGGALKSVQQRVKQVALDLTDLEMVVEEATNSEPWGPHGKLLARIASEAGQSEEKFREIMGVLVDRISAAWRKPKQWRWAYKSLLVLDFIIKNGPEQVARELSDDESMDIFNGLAKFKYVEENTLKDFGVNVRKRATDIAALLNDPERLAEERVTAAKSKSKLGGMGRKDTYSGGFSSASPTALHETENTAGWGKQRNFASGPTLVRTKPSFSVPEPLRIREEVEPTKSSASPVSADILGLGTPEEDPPSGPSGLTPLKGDESQGASNQEERAPPSHQQQKGKPKLLSETKINPKMRLSLKGFKSPPTSASTQQTTATGSGRGAGTLDADLMSLSAPEVPQPSVPQPGGPVSSWDSFASTETTVKKAENDWTAFDEGAGAGNVSKIGDISDLFAQGNSHQASTGLPAAQFQSQQPQGALPTDWMPNLSLGGGGGGPMPVPLQQPLHPPPPVADSNVSQALDPMLFGTRSAVPPMGAGVTASTVKSQSSKEDPFKDLGFGMIK